MAPLEFRSVPVDLALRTVTVVAITGEIDTSAVPQLRDHLAMLPDRDTAVDLSGVPLLSAAGCCVLLDLLDRLDRAGARIVLAAVPPGPRRALAATGLDTTLPAAHTVAHAVVLITTGTTAPPAPRPRSRHLRPAGGRWPDRHPSHRRHPRWSTPTRHRPSGGAPTPPHGHPRPGGIR